MAITKFETVEVNNLSFATSSYGETQTTKTVKFTSRPLISEVRANVATSEKFRIYSDLVQMKFVSGVQFFTFWCFVKKFFTLVFSTVSMSKSYALGTQ